MDKLTDGRTDMYEKITFATQLADVKNINKPKADDRVKSLEKMWLKMLGIQQSQKPKSPKVVKLFCTSVCQS